MGTWAIALPWLGHWARRRGATSAADLYWKTGGWWIIVVGGPKVVNFADAFCPEGVSREIGGVGGRARPARPARQRPRGANFPDFHIKFVSLVIFFVGFL